MGRVTGGQPSAIDGLLRSEIAGANLFLLNPSGVLFGPNASLDVGGSFHVSTADFLRLADGAKFFANLGQESVLTVAEPAAFGFLGPNPAGITIQGSSLKVAEGKAVSVIGGDITFVGIGAPPYARPTLGAASGRVQLASVASPGEVLFSPLELAPDLQVDSFAQLGRIALSQGAFIDASGNGGGTVFLRSGRLAVDNAWMFADNTGPMDGVSLGLDLGLRADAVIRNNALLTADTVGAGQARQLRLTAGHLHLEHALIGSRAFAAGASGHIMVRVGTLTLTGGAQIRSTTFGPSRGGAVTVTATEAITIAGQDQGGALSGLFSTTLGSGDGGRLVISAPTLTMDGGALATLTSAGGRAGDLAVQVERLTLTGGAQIDSRNVGRGQVGTVTVTATDAILLAGRNSLHNLLWVPKTRRNRKSADWRPCHHAARRS